MRFPTLVAIVSVIVLIGIGYQQPAAGDSNATDSIFRFHEFPGYPRLTHLCQERVYGSGLEIHWDAFASPASPSELVDYYRQKLGDAGFTREGEGGTWGRPADAPSPRALISIMAIGTDNPSRNCEKKPPSDSRAIIILSTMYKH
jgi:hypothetical protein